MRKETITYEDWDGNERKEEFLFNISKSELFTMQYEKEGGLAAYLQKILAAKDSVKLITFFNWLLLESYAEKTEDGKSLIKTEEIKNKFKGSIPYDIIYNKMLEDPDYAMKFIQDILPKVDKNAVQTA